MQNSIEPSAALRRRISVSTSAPAIRAPVLRWAVFTKYFLSFWWKGSEEQRQAWLRQRLQLFREFCVPALLEQSDALDCWILFAEESLHAELSAVLAPLVARNKVRFLTAKSVADFQARVGQSIESLQSDLASDEYLLCTRLDNDDALSRDFYAVNAALLRELGAGLDGRVLSFAYGAQLDRPSDIARAHLFTNNHFLCSVHSRTSPAEPNCLSFNHTNLFGDVPNVQLFFTRHPMWLEIIHQENLKNRAIDGLPLSMQAVLERFIPQGSDTRSGEAAAAPVALKAEHITQRTAHANEALAARRDLVATVRQAISDSGAMKPLVFGDVYASVLSRVQPRRLFEIGIHQGGSVRMWRQLLGPEATIACMDIKAECCANAEGVADHVFVGSQIDPELLQRVGLEAGPFDVVIDDGSHQNPHMILTLENMFGLVRPGGSYVIEDMFTSYWPRYRGGLRRSDSLMEFLKARLDGLYAPFLSSKYKAHFLETAIPAMPSDPIASQVESIEFFGAGIVVLHKRGQGS